MRGAPRGFADHPHRGVETITLVTAGGDGEGELVHEASDGTTQRLAGDGGDHLPDVVHTHCGRGVIVSELPAAGIVHGLHVWLNTSRRHKMRAPETTVAKTEAVVVEPGGAAVRDVGAALRDARAADEGDVLSGLVFLHVALPPGAAFERVLPREQSALVYVLRGALEILGQPDDGRRRRRRRADAGCCCALRDDADGVRLRAHARARAAEPAARGHARRAVRLRARAALRAAARRAHRAVRPVRRRQPRRGERAMSDFQLGHNGFDVAQAWHERRERTG